ncbi:LysR family transcriptional regulator [Phyllobacterium sp. 628]|uniref:LysR family transcriptional regulator n=1 Tax=Phyllobacterium sp. 628 TaxID=2718938 RepID=UPI00166237FE|nr:LysR family transcriptional regulator [Phyllobacterium sp. 628]QND52638.1 LysR family transcriptional regulator [Phyllobacterium sp. 628]
MNNFDNRLDLNLFRVLDAIHANGSISGAARALHLTQPAISHSLARLRDMFGDQLFVRQGNRMVATERVRGIIADVRRSLHGLYAAVETATDFSPARLSMDFKVALRDVLESATFSPLIRQLASEAPGVCVVSRRVAREIFEKELASGSLDLAIDRKIKVGPHIRQKTLLREPNAVVVRQGHALSSRKITQADYVAATHVLVTHIEGMEPIDYILAEQGQGRKVGLRCQHFFAACKVIAETDWVLTMPRTYALELSAVLAVDVLAAPLAIPPIDLVMYWHAARDEDQGHRWMRDLFAEVMSKYGGGASLSKDISAVHD